MSVQVALLRAVNLGPSKRLPMVDLTRAFVQLGFADARTVLQTGNVVFRSPRVHGLALERHLEAGLRTQLSLETDVHVRSAEEWRSLVAVNPFPREAVDDPSHLLVVLLHDAPPPSTLALLRGRIAGRERVELSGRTAYVVYPDGIGESKVTMRLIESALGTRATGRNWNTAMKLAALCQ